ncbi:HNH endonuclease [Georgenia sp. 311]|uniref:HNH endonuclease n=1 Tax=Georgenia sp. 311 TaxID=2585134 RepID=UPI001111BBE6|nr:HNH endonuclease signature motif containing protein [Georgenia sp. 311]TNC21251.1 HNH endonuclease [Georgenia sp. 311]
MPAPILVLLLLGAIVVVPAATGSFGQTLAAIVLILVANPVVRSIRKNRYFASEHFQVLKSEIASVVSEHNEVVGYVREIRARGSFELGSSLTGQYANLASFENTSTWNNRRDRNVAEYAPHVHNASLQVVRNASADPIKYLMKYFSVKADQKTLADVQHVADSIARLEEAVANVKAREAAITAKINPPAFILKHYRDEFWNQVGVRLSPIEVPYPEYKFQYISAGGNSGQTTRIVLNTPTLEALSATLVDKIRWVKSAAGQRALMTAKLRSHIKQRDNYTCLNCGVSIYAEPHLLLEVDHIVPVSKGGLSVPENLQTLCWKCNRTKGARIVA